MSNENNLVLFDNCDNTNQTNLHPDNADIMGLIEDKFIGSLLGAIIGDALGWPFEDRSKFVGKKPEVGTRNKLSSWFRYGGGRYYAHREEIKAGEYSDDSQLLLATARSLRYGNNWSKVFFKRELPAWLLYERGGGGATLRAAESWSKSISPWKNVDLAKKYFDAGGNGVAMRILPHVFISHGDLNEISKQVMINGISTHGHPRALLGAILYGWAVNYLINLKTVLGFGELIDYLLATNDCWGQLPKWQNADEWLENADKNLSGYSKVWENTAEELTQGLLVAKEAIAQGVLNDTTETLATLNCFNPQNRGAGTVAALVSIFIASKYASDPNTGMLQILSLDKADTDTLASMIGGLYGSIYGSEFIRNEWTHIQDYDYVCNLIRTLKPVKQNEIQINWWSESDNAKVKRLVKTMEVGQTVVFGPLGTIKAVEKLNHNTEVKNLNVFSIKFLTEEGQIIYIKGFVKTSSGANYLPPPPKHQTQNALKLNSGQISQLAGLLPGRLTAKKALNLIASVLLSLESHTVNLSEEDVNKIASRLVDKGINYEQVKDIVKYLDKTIMRTEDAIK